MRKFALLMLSAIALAGMAQAGKSVHVRGHTTKSGKIVSGHNRTAPDKTQKNNWSAKGNVNPNTGKRGTKTPVK